MDSNKKAIVKQEIGKVLDQLHGLKGRLFQRLDDTKEKHRLNTDASNSELLELKVKMIRMLSTEMQFTIDRFQDLYDSYD